MWTCGTCPLTSAHVRIRKVLYTRTCTHIFKAPSAPECTKIAAPAHVRMRAYARTLKVWKYCCISGLLQTLDLVNANFYKL